MKHGKLKELAKKEKKFERLVRNFGIPAILLLMIELLIIIISNGVVQKFTLIPIICVAILSVIIYIFNFKAVKYGKNIYDYICVRVMDIMVGNGIETSNFEMIEEADTHILYIGFHNQKVDYDYLNSALTQELDVMNKISGRNIRVKLI